MNDQRISRQFDKARLREQIGNRRYVLLEDVDQVVVADVTCRYEQEFPWGLVQQERIHKIYVLFHYHSLVFNGETVDLLVESPVPRRKFEGV